MDRICAKHDIAIAFTAQIQNGLCVICLFASDSQTSKKSRHNKRMSNDTFFCSILFHSRLKLLLCLRSLSLFPAQPVVLTQRTYSQSKAAAYYFYIALCFSGFSTSLWNSKQHSIYFILFGADADFIEQPFVRVSCYTI